MALTAGEIATLLGVNGLSIEDDFAYVKVDELVFGNLPDSRQLAAKVYVRRLAANRIRVVEDHGAAAAVVREALDRQEAGVSADGFPRKKTFFLGGAGGKNPVETYFMSAGGYGNLPVQLRTLWWDPILWVTTDRTILTFHVINECRCVWSALGSMADAQLSRIEAAVTVFVTLWGDEDPRALWQKLAPQIRLIRDQFSFMTKLLSLKKIWVKPLEEESWFLPPYLRTIIRDTKDSKEPTFQPRSGTSKRIVCHNCEKPGHMARNCHAPRRNREERPEEEKRDDATTKKRRV